MGQKTVRFSDLSGEIITQDDALARVVIHEHPGLGDGPVEIEALADEARAIEKAALRVAVVDLYLPGEQEPRRVAMELDAFDELATGTPMSEILSTAPPARRGAVTSKSSRTGGVGRAGGAEAARADRTNYASLEHAGKPHKGKTTDAERQLVREHLDEINERLAAAGLRTISLADPDHVERYGLAELAELAGRRPGKADQAE